MATTFINFIVIFTSVLVWCRWHSITATALKAEDCVQSYSYAVVGGGGSIFMIHGQRASFIKNRSIWMMVVVLHVYF